MVSDCKNLAVKSRRFFKRCLQYKKDTQEKAFSEYQHFDTTRGIFTEGGPAFEGAGIQMKNHIQICIRNLNCIKGFFIPREKVKFQ